MTSFDNVVMGTALQPHCCLYSVADETVTGPYRLACSISFRTKVNQKENIRGVNSHLQFWQHIDIAKDAVKCL